MVKFFYKRYKIQYLDSIWDRWNDYSSHRTISKCQKVIGKQIGKRFSCQSWRIFDKDKQMPLYVFLYTRNCDVYNDAPDLYKRMVLDANRHIHAALVDLNTQWRTDCGAS
jgi:hypothetical protein